MFCLLEHNMNAFQTTICNTFQMRFKIQHFQDSNSRFSQHLTTCFQKKYSYQYRALRKLTSKLTCNFELILLKFTEAILLTHNLAILLNRGQNNIVSTILCYKLTQILTSICKSIFWLRRIVTMGSIMIMWSGLRQPSIKE